MGVSRARRGVMPRWLFCVLSVSPLHIEVSAGVHFHVGAVQSGQGGARAVPLQMLQPLRELREGGGEGVRAWGGGADTRRERGRAHMVAVVARR